ncbi:MAG: fibronectin type III domain-containing protein [Ketobacter sp.]|nr:fibronectin type III domain-containing protein [Ketobacter sp.]
MNYKTFREVQPERGIHGNFASGQINYVWKTAENTAWVPAQSYFRIKLKLSAGVNDAKPTISDDVALNMMAADNLFQQIELRVNGVKVSEWGDYVAQCAALKCRLHCDMNNRQSLLSSINYTKIDMLDRQAQLCSDGWNQKNTVFRPGPSLPANAASGTVLDFLDMGTPNMVQFVAAENTIIFSANGGERIPDMMKYFAIGDFIYFNDGVEAANLVTGFRTAVSQNDTIVVGAVANNLGPANYVAQVRIHDKYYIDRRYSNTEQNSEIELIWRPPIGFFDIASEVSGSYKLELSPLPRGVWEKYVVESLDSNLEPGVDYEVEITEMNLYLWTHVHPRPINESPTFVYTDIRCNSQNLTTKSLTSTVFNVHPNNHSLTVAYQDSAVGDDTRYSRSKFKITNDQELQIKRYYIQMDGITLPDPLPSLELEPAEGINILYQRYVENFHYSGAYSSGMKKFETMEEWKKAGIFFHYKWGTGYKKSGTAIVYSNFDQRNVENQVPKLDWLGEANAVLRNPQILLFDHYYCTVSMNIKDGELISIEKM